MMTGARNATSPRMSFNVNVLVMYAILLFLCFATSLTSRVDKPKSEKTMNSSTNAKTKEYFPSPTSPRNLAMMRMSKKAKNAPRPSPNDKMKVFLDNFCDSSITAIRHIGICRFICFAKQRSAKMLLALAKNIKIYKCP